MAIAGALQDHKTDIIASYLRGTTVSLLAKTYGVSVQAIKVVLKQDGVYPRTPEVLELIRDRVKPLALELRNTGLRVKSIAERLGVSSHIVTELLHKEEVLPKLKRGENSTKKRKIKPDQETELIALYSSGATQLELAKKYDCTETVIHRFLVKAGVVLRPRGQVSPYRTDPAFVDRVLELWKEGTSITKISSELKVASNPVSRVLEEHGITNTKAKREKHGMWKGGRSINPYGYTLIRIGSNHKFASMRTVNGYVLEHRLVMAEHLGRHLLDKESVHHINGNHADNRIDNLQLRSGSHGEHICYRCLDCGSYRVAPTEL